MWSKTSRVVADPVEDGRAQPGLVRFPLLGLMSPVCTKESSIGGIGTGRSLRWFLRFEILSGKKVPPESLWK